LLYIAYRYNIFYALSIAVDTKGDAYGLALQHLTVGIYLAELCLIGLLAAKGAKGPSQLIVLLFIATVVYQSYLNWVLSPILISISDKMLGEDEENLLAETRMENGESGHQVRPISSLINENLNTKYGSQQSRLAAHREKGGLFARYLFHGEKSSYSKLRNQLSSDFPGQPVQRIPAQVKALAYFHPAITAPDPIVWIAKDEFGISEEQIKELRGVVNIVDSGAKIDGKGNVVWNEEDLTDAPLWKERIDL
jgi:hypothetical protein